LLQEFSQFEPPREVVTEAIVNAVAHRDYTSAGSVQVMLFADRLEVWIPGTLPPTHTLAKLRDVHGLAARISTVRPSVSVRPAQWSSESDARESTSALDDAGRAPCGDWPSEATV